MEINGLKRVYIVDHTGRRTKAVLDEYTRTVYYGGLKISRLWELDKKITDENGLEIKQVI